MTCTLAVAHCRDCGSTDLHEGPYDPPPYCCCMRCGSADVVEVDDENRTDPCDGSHRPGRRRKPAGYVGRWCEVDWCGLPNWHTGPCQAVLA